MLVRAEALSKRYGTRVAIDTLSFEAEEGCVVGILGANGAGKSTTMNILSGILAPDSGSVSIHGISLAHHPCQAKKQIGYLPEIPPVYADMRVKEYLRFCARLREIHGKAIQACVDQAMERCQLHAVANRLIGQLSKGYQQRTGIAQAILHAPKLLILDEPTVGLDPNQLAEIRRLIKQIGESCTIILSTHILAEVEATCDRVLILKEGHKVFDGTMDQFNPQQMRDWTIRFLAPPSTDQLSTFLQELRIDQIASDTWKIRNLTDENRLSLLLDHAVSQGWRPIELYRHQHTLEEKFIALTCGQEPPENTMDSLKMEPV